MNKFYNGYVSEYRRYKQHVHNADIVCNHYIFLLFSAYKTAEKKRTRKPRQCGTAFRSAMKS